jgi:diguanylate cyclase (GGDEF)-like protein
VVRQLVVDRRLELITSRFDGPIRVGALGCLVAGLAAAIYALALTGLDAPGDLRVPWWTLVLVFGVAEASVVHLHFRSEAHSLSLSEAGLVFGLFFASPFGLISAQLAGGSLALLAFRRQRPLKVAFNLAQFALSSCLALLIFRALTDVAAGNGPPAWLAAFAAAGAASVTGVGLVGVAIALSEGRKTLRELPKMLGIGLGGALATASLAIAAAELLQRNAWAVTLLVVPALGCALALRAYAGQRRRHAHVEFLYQSMRAMQSAPGLESAVRELLVAARSMLAAEHAEILFLPSTAGEPALRSSIGPTVERLLETTTLSDQEALAVEAASDDADAILLPRGRPRHPLDGFLEERGLPDAMLTALRAEARVVGVLLVGRRAGDVSTFNPDDRKLFETFASHAGVLLENDRVKEQLRYQAYHDALTGLPNRLLFADEVRQALARGRAREAPAVLFLDLDDFKTINDSLGHGAGDELLVAVADRLRSHVRPRDVVARLGGDEFAVLLERTEIGAAERAAERLVRALRSPFVLSGHEMSIHASIGVAGHYGAGTADELLRNADVAMYSAKDNGKRGYAVYEPEMHARVRRRQELIASVERAVQRSEISAHYQPIVSLADGETIALEALARWQHPERGLVPPGSFIPIAEETGLMVPIGRRILRQACRDLALWQKNHRGQGDLSVTVNLSPSELQNPKVAEEVAQILAETQIPPRSLTLEITESGAMRDQEATIETLHVLRGLGVRLALDDFGTGYSSLSHLREFPIDILKIAKPFVEDLGEGTSDPAFLEAILGLARALDLTVIVEGIETADQAETLHRLGCRIGQGYHFARPLDRTAAAAHLGVRPLAAA